MKEPIVVPVILAGGSGTRLWPSSRAESPKQFLPLTSKHSLFQETLKRMPKASYATPIVVTNVAHSFVVEEHAETLKRSICVVAETMARGTAPAVAVAAQVALKNYGKAQKPLICVLPADHLITNQSVFGAAMKQGIIAARAGSIVTFGIVPQYPETGYGYIKSKNSHAKSKKYEPIIIEQFVEKPSREVAEQYVASGNYYWNSGMYIMRADVFLSELKKFAPSVYAWSLKAPQMQKDFSRVSLLDSLTEPEHGSVDTMVMEKTKRGVVIPCDPGWSDVGSWSSLHSSLPHDASGNIIVGDVITRDTTDSYIRSEHRLVAAVGVSNLMLIETANAVLALDARKAQDVGKLVAELKAGNRSEAFAPRKHTLPWGTHDTIDIEPQSQVHKLSIKSKKNVTISYHQAAHLVLTKGSIDIATVSTKPQRLSSGRVATLEAGVSYTLKNNHATEATLVVVECVL
ncbi:MAG: mannose-1-phosphate guanylyltransferase/mannose-6-phosphate isomerase [Minisyncoccia bacterium]